MDLKKKFGLRLRALRSERDLSQEDLADALGMSVRAVRNMELGVNAPTFKNLERLAGVLGVPVKALFDFDALEDT